MAIRPNEQEPSRFRHKGTETVRIGEEWGMVKSNRLFGTKVGGVARKWSRNESSVGKNRSQEIKIGAAKPVQWTRWRASKQDGQSWCLSPERCSSCKRFIRVLAVVRCFVENCRIRKKESGELKPTEIEDADVETIRNAQREAFYEEYIALQCLKELPKNSKVLALRRQSDEEGLIRCDGWLKYAENVL